MTNEEAIAILSDVGDINRCCRENAEALDMAIKALEQQPCDDCISRADVLALAEKGTLVSNGNYKSVCKAINDLPSVTPKYTDEEIDKAQAVEQAYIDKMVELAVEELKTPKTEWIPVSERLPEKAGKYLVTVKNGNVYAGVYDAFSGQFQCAATAWMPLPEPYKAESEG